MPVAEWSFPALTGVAALAYLLQNAVISIVRNQKYPENNVSKVHSGIIKIRVNWIGTFLIFM